MNLTMRIAGAAFVAALAGGQLAACAQEAADTSHTKASAQELAEAALANQNLVAAEPPAGGWPADSAYGYDFEGLLGGDVPMSAFKDKVVLVVNTASKCGFTPQYEGLQALYDDMKDKGVVVLGVPSGDFMGQEFNSSEEIAEFCTLNYGVTFPMTAKYHVKGKDAHPFYKWAKAQLGKDAVPGWNFHKILIGRDGRAIEAFGTRTKPTSDDIRAATDKALAS